MLKTRPLLAVMAVAFAGFLGLQVNWQDLMQTLGRVSLAHLVIGLLLVQIQIALSALRWRFTAGRLGQAISTGDAIGEYYVASFLNQTLPGGMAGDAARAYRMKMAGPGGWKIPAKAVLFERVSGQIAFFLFAALGLAAWPNIATIANAPSATIFLLAAILGIAAICLFAFWIISRSTGYTLGGAIGDDLSAVFLKDGAWVVQFALSLCVVLSYIAAFLVAAEAIGADMPLVAGLTVIPLCLLAMLIPTGFGGWGTREAAAMALFPLMNATAAQGLATSLVYGGISLAGALPGLVLLVWNQLRPKAPV